MKDTNKIKKLRYRIRVGTKQFKDPHYITAISPEIRYTSTYVSKSYLSWAKKDTAKENLKTIIQQIPSARIEKYYANN